MAGTCKTHSTARDKAARAPHPPPHRHRLHGCTRGDTAQHNIAHSAQIVSTRSTLQFCLLLLLLYGISVFVTYYGYDVVDVVVVDVNDEDDVVSDDKEEYAADIAVVDITGVFDHDLKMSIVIAIVDVAAADDDDDDIGPTQNVFQNQDTGPNLYQTHYHHINQFCE